MVVQPSIAQSERRRSTLRWLVATVVLVALQVVSVMLLPVSN